jgi:hypothetical protein
MVTTPLLRIFPSQSFDLNLLGRALPTGYFELETFFLTYNFLEVLDLQKCIKFGLRHKQ